MDHVITDSGFNEVAAGAELFGMLKLDAANIKFPEQHAALSEIADFVNSYGEEALHQLRMVAAKQPLPPDQMLTRFRQFSGLQMKRISAAKQLEQIDQELMMFR